VENTLLIRDSEALSASLAEASWFAVYTSARHEKSVCRHCEQRQLESFLPLYQARHRWKNGCTVELDLPLFPNYVFVRMALRQRVSVLQVPGVLALVGPGGRPQALPPELIESLRSGLGRRRAEPHPYLVVGHRVRIKAGPLAGLEGVLFRKKDSLRVVITLSQILQSASVEVDAAEVEDLGRAA
jgi:transcription antitermination factor NusG